MKDNNEIDILFKQGLKEHQVTPREDSRAKFLANVQQKKKKVIPIWYYASAAAVLFAVGLYLFNISPENSTQMADLSNQASPETVVAQVEKISANIDTDLSNPKVEGVMVAKKSIKEPKAKSSAKNTVQSKEAVSELAQNINTITKIADVPSLTPSKNNAILDEMIPDELTLAYLESEKEKNSKAISQNNSGELFQSSVGETIIIIAAEPEIEETIFIPELSEDSNMTLAQATELAEQRNEDEKGFLAKVFTEIKHLKHGEKVDMTTLANNINNSDGFIANEAEELKDRFNWVRNKIGRK